MQKYILLPAIFLALISQVLAQNNQITGRITSDGKPVPYATILLVKTTFGAQADSTGSFKLGNFPAGRYELLVSAIGFQRYVKRIDVAADQSVVLNAELSVLNNNLSEVVVTGVSRATELRKSPIAIAVMSKKEMDMNVNNNLVDAVLKGVPGLSAVTTGPNVSKPFIRGLGYNRVLTLYNGIRQEGQQWGRRSGRSGGSGRHSG